MKYTDKNGVEHTLEYILKINTETPKYFATNKVTFSDPEIAGVINLPEGLMEIPGTLNRKIDIQNCSMTTGVINITIQNTPDYKTTQWLYETINSNTDKIYKQDAILWKQLDGVLTREFTGKIRKQGNLNPYETAITFQISDIREEMTAKIFEKELSENDETSPVLPTGFSYSIRTSDGAMIYLSTSLAAFLGTEDVLIDDILIVDFGGTGEAYYINKNGFNAVADDWEQINGTSITINKILILETTNPLDAAIAIFKVIFGDPDYLDFIETSSFDISNYDDEKNVPFYWEFKEPLSNPQEFIEENIYQLMNAYPTVTAAGKIRLIRQKQPTTDDPTILLNELKIIKILSNENIFSNLTNNVNINYDYDYREEETRLFNNYRSDSSVTKYGLSPKQVFEVDVNIDKKMTELQRENFIISIANNLFNRFDLKLKIIKLETFISEDLTEGDYVVFEHSKMVDWEGGNEGKRGVISTPESEFLLIDRNESWGDFVGENKDNLVGYLDVGETEDVKVIQVNKKVDSDFFNFLTTNSILMNQFNVKDNIHSKHWEPKGTGTDEGNWGDFQNG